MFIYLPKITLYSGILFCHKYIKSLGKMKDDNVFFYFKYYVIIYTLIFQLRFLKIDGNCLVVYKD